MAEELNPNNNNPDISDAPEVLPPQSDDILRQLSSDYTEYMKIDIKKESTEFEDSIEEMLTRLDEFCGLVDMIRSDTNLCLGRTLPSIHKKCLEMEKMFNKIDQLEAFVRVVSQDVAVVERQVEEAENEMGSLSGIKKVFKSFPIPPFLSKKQEKPPAASASKTKYIPPEIFRTDIYLHADSPGTSGTTSIPHVPVIPAVPSSELLTGSGGAASGAEKHGATSESGAAEKTLPNAEPDSSAAAGSSVHSNQDVTPSSGDAPTNSSSKPSGDQVNPHTPNTGDQVNPDASQGSSAENKTSAASDSVPANQDKDESSTEQTARA